MRAYNGLASLTQPTIAPLFASQSILSCLQAMIPGSEESDYDLIRAYWQKERGQVRLASDWETWLYQGYIPETEHASVTWTRPQWTQESLVPIQSLPQDLKAHTIQVDLVLRPDPSIGEGQMANNPWLQELPKPFSKLTWDHALLIHP